MRAIATKRMMFALVVLALGCGPTAGGGSTVTPDGGATKPGPDPQGVAEDDSMGALTRRLDRLVGQERGMHAAATSDAGRCEELCELATAICSVQEKVCELADAHPNDDAYQGLCREARNECREAQESCVACASANQTPGPEPTPQK